MVKHRGAMIICALYFFVGSATSCWFLILMIPKVVESVGTIHKSHEPSHKILTAFILVFTIFLGFSAPASAVCGTAIIIIGGTKVAPTATYPVEGEQPQTVQVQQLATLSISVET